MAPIADLEILPTTRGASERTVIYVQPQVPREGQNPAPTQPSPQQQQPIPNSA
ncbi:hypothetical protein FRC02_005108 [Tulasnella sp. 418]|nr:hypothetical protein FRC02_005108 [Tulasnella sp. 418]